MLAFLKQYAPLVWHWVLLFLFSLWEHWLARTKKVAANSTWELFFWVVGRLFKRKEQSVEKEIVKGEAGELKVTVMEGKVRLEGAGEIPGQVGVTAGGFIQCDAEVLVNKLFAEIEKKTPDAVDAVLEMGKPALIAALKNIK